jgi:hypothetical protein
VRIIKTADWEGATETAMFPVLFRGQVGLSTDRARVLEQAQTLARSILHTVVPDGDSDEEHYIIEDTVLRYKAGGVITAGVLQRLRLMESEISNHIVQEDENQLEWVELPFRFLYNGELQDIYVNNSIRDSPSHITSISQAGESRVFPYLNDNATTIADFRFVNIVNRGERPQVRVRGSLDSDHHINNLMAIENQCILNFASYDINSNGGTIPYDGTWSRVDTVVLFKSWSEVAGIVSILEQRAGHLGERSRRERQNIIQIIQGYERSVLMSLHEDCPLGDIETGPDWLVHERALHYKLDGCFHESQGDRSVWDLLSSRDEWAVEALVARGFDVNTENPEDEFDESSIEWRRFEFDLLYDGDLFQQINNDEIEGDSSYSRINRDAIDGVMTDAQLEVDRYLRSTNSVEGRDFVYRDFPGDAHRNYPSYAVGSELDNRTDRKNIADIERSALMKVCHYSNSLNRRHPEMSPVSAAGYVLFKARSTLDTFFLGGVSDDELVKIKNSGEENVLDYLTENHPITNVFNPPWLVYDRYLFIDENIIPIDYFEEFLLDNDADTIQYLSDEGSSFQRNPDGIRVPEGYIRFPGLKFLFNSLSESGVMVRDANPPTRIPIGGEVAEIIELRTVQQQELVTWMDAVANSEIAYSFTNSADAVKFNNRLYVLENGALNNDEVLKRTILSWDRTAIQSVEHASETMPYDFIFPVNTEDHTVPEPQYPEDERAEANENLINMLSGYDLANRPLTFDISNTGIFYGTWTRFDGTELLFKSVDYLYDNCRINGIPLNQETLTLISRQLQDVEDQYVSSGNVIFVPQEVAPELLYTKNTTVSSEIFRSDNIFRNNLADDFPGFTFEDGDADPRTRVRNGADFHLLDLDLLFKPRSMRIQNFSLNGGLVPRDIMEDITEWCSGAEDLFISEVNAEYFIFDGRNGKIFAREDANQLETRLLRAEEGGRSTLSERYQGLLFTGGHNGAQGPSETPEGRDFEWLEAPLTFIFNPVNIRWKVRYIFQLAPFNDQELDKELAESVVKDYESDLKRYLTSFFPDDGEWMEKDGKLYYAANGQIISNPSIMTKIMEYNHAAIRQFTNSGAFSGQSLLYEGNLEAAYDKQFDNQEDFIYIGNFSDLKNNDEVILAKMYVAKFIEAVTSRRVKYGIDFALWQEGNDKTSRLYYNNKDRSGDDISQTIENMYSEYEDKTHAVISALRAHPGMRESLLRGEEYDLMEQEMDRGRISLAEELVSSQISEKETWARELVSEDDYQYIAKELREWDLVAEGTDVPTDNIAGMGADIKRHLFKRVINKYSLVSGYDLGYSEGVFRNDNDNHYKAISDLMGKLLSNRFTHRKFDRLAESRGLEVPKFRDSENIYESAIAMNEKDALPINKLIVEAGYNIDVGRGVNDQVIKGRVSHLIKYLLYDILERSRSSILRRSEETNYKKVIKTVSTRLISQEVIDKLISTNVHDPKKFVESFPTIESTYESLAYKNLRIAIAQEVMKIVGNK